MFQYLRLDANLEYGIEGGRESRIVRRLCVHFQAISLKAWPTYAFSKPEICKRLWSNDGQFLTVSVNKFQITVHLVGYHRLKNIGIRNSSHKYCFVKFRTEQRDFVKNGIRLQTVFNCVAGVDKDPTFKQLKTGKVLVYCIKRARFAFCQMLRLAHRNLSEPCCHRSLTSFEQN